MHLGLLGVIMDGMTYSLVIKYGLNLGIIEYLGDAS